MPESMANKRRLAIKAQSALQGGITLSVTLQDASILDEISEELEAEAQI